LEISLRKIIKPQILNFLNEIKNDNQITAFFGFLIEIKTLQHLSKDQLYAVLMEIIREDHGEGIDNLVRDTLDYFVGWHAPLKASHPAYEFIQQLNS